MSEYFCTNCGTDLDNQPGFNPNSGYWTCRECGQFLVDPEDMNEDAQFVDVGWFCDSCGAYLNRQSGFNDWRDTWTCTECGYENCISEDQIYESEEEYLNSRSVSYDDDEDEEDDYEDEEDDYEDEEDDCDYEEYQNRIRERVEEEERARAERLKREEKQRRKAEQRKVRWQRIWRTVTRKKQTPGVSSKQCCDMKYNNLIEILKKREFYNISTTVLEDLGISEDSKEGQIEHVSFNGMGSSDEKSQFPYNSQIHITYHTFRKVNPPLTSRGAKRRNVEDVVKKFLSAGFGNVEKAPVPDLVTGWIVKENSVKSVTIDGKDNYKNSDKIRINAHVVISYHAFER